MFTTGARRDAQGGFAPLNSGFQIGSDHHQMIYFCFHGPDHTTALVGIDLCAQSIQPRQLLCPG